MLSIVSGSPALAIAGGATFGLVRGLAVLLTRQVRTPDALHAVHQQVQRAGPRLHELVLAVELGVATTAALVFDARAGVVVGAASAIALVHRHRRGATAPICDLDAGRRYVVAADVPSPGG